MSIKEILKQYYYFIYVLFIYNFCFSQLALQNFKSSIPSTNWMAASATGGYLAHSKAELNPDFNNTDWKVRIIL